MTPLLACLSLLATTPFAEASAAYARADAEAVIAIYRRTPPAIAQDHALLGQAFFLNEKYTEAASEFAKAVAKEPRQAEHHLWLGRATGRRAEQASPLRAPGLAIETRKHFERAVELDPKSAEALSDLFDYYLNAPGFLGGGESKAAALIPKVRDFDPPQAFYLVAKRAEKRKDWMAAESALQQAIAAAPDQPGRQIDLARFYAKRGRVDDAEAVFRKVDPKYPPLFYARAEMLIEAARNPGESRQLLRDYLSMPLTPGYPTRREAEKLLAKLP